MLFNFVAKPFTVTVIMSGEFVAYRLLAGAIAEVVSGEVGTTVTQWLITEDKD